MTAPTSAASSYRRLFANPGYVRVLAAGLASTLGSAIAGICLVWIVWVQTASAVDVALLGTAWLAAAISFSVFGGTLVDRYDRRRLMILSDLGRAAALGSVVVVFFVWGFDLPVLLVAQLVGGALTTVFNPAEQAVVPSLVAPELVGDSNGLVRVSRSSAQFVGAAIGGLLIVTLGPLLGVALNIATFGVSAALLTGMVVSSPSRASRFPHGGLSAYLDDVRAGFRWLYRATGFLQLTFSATVFNFCSNLIATFIVVFATVVLHGSAIVFAGLLAVEVAGNAFGALLVSRVGAVRWAGRAWTIPYGVVSGVLAVVLALFPSIPTALVVLFALGALAGFSGTAWLTAAQLLVPTEMQGRYFGIDALGSVAILPASQIGGALLIGVWGTRATYLAVGLVWVVFGLVFLLPRALRRLGVPPHPEDEASFRSDGGAAGTLGSPVGTRSE